MIYVNSVLHAYNAYTVKIYKYIIYHMAAITATLDITVIIDNAIL